MTSMNDVKPNDLITKAAEELKGSKKITPPAWASFVKTGIHKERPPVDKDWWYQRCAAVLRAVAVLGPIGVSKLRTKYGGKQRKGHKPSHFAKGSGSVIRKILQQLEQIGYIKQEAIGVHKGRVVTKEGKLFLTSVAKKVAPEKKTETKEQASSKKDPEKKPAKEKKPEKAEEKKAEEKTGKSADEEKPEKKAENKKPASSNKEPEQTPAKKEPKTESSNKEAAKGE